MRKLGSVVLALVAGGASMLAATYTVSTTNDSGAGSLRQAVLDANGNAGADTIAFNIPGSGVHAIVLGSALPTITDAVTIDVYCPSSPNTRGQMATFLGKALRLP